MSYNVRQPDIEKALRDIGGLIRAALPAQGWGFTLLIYSFGQVGTPGEGPEGSMFYISNADRDDMIKAMQEFISRNQH